MDMNFVACARGGVVFWGDHVGVERIYSKLKHWSTLYGSFYQPSAALERAAHGKYPLVSVDSIPSGGGAQIPATF